MPGLARDGLFRSFLAACLASVAVTVWMTGCGTSPNPAESCKVVSQIDLAGDPQVVALLKDAGYHDCLVGYETDNEKAETLRRQGQAEALKGTMLMAMRSPDAQLLRARVLGASDVNTLLGFFYVLKASGRFSDADVKKLDETFPHLQIAAAFQNYEQLPSPH